MIYRNNAFFLINYLIYILLFNKFYHNFYFDIKYKLFIIILLELKNFVIFH